MTEEIGVGVENFIMNEELKQLAETVIKLQSDRSQFEGHVKILCTALPLLSEGCDPHDMHYPEILAGRLTRFDTELTRLALEKQS